MSTEPTNDRLAYEVAIARLIARAQAGDVASAADAARAVEVMVARLVEKSRAMLDALSCHTPDWLRGEAIALEEAVAAATKPYTVTVLFMQGYGESFGTLNQAFEYAAQEAKKIDEQDDPICEGIICEHVDGTPTWTLVEENGLYSWQLDNDAVTQPLRLARQQELDMPSEAERQQMEAAGFTWDPTEPWAGAYPRWTHFDKNITVTRQPYMTDKEWEQHKAEKIAEANNFKINE